MKATIQKSKAIGDVYSASGIEFLNDQIYIIGDDSPWLYVLNKQGVLQKKVKLFEPVEEGLGRIPKKQKPDLETLSTVTFKGQTFLLTLGSGSKKDRRRDVGFLINAESFEITRLNLEGLYDSLRRMEEVVGEKKLNIEGLATTPTEVILLARGNVSGKNVMIAYSQENLMAHLLYGENLLIPEITSFTLPSVDGIPAGFSGAAYVESKNCILFTASVEDTETEIDDGKSLGSFIGTFDLSGPLIESFRFCPICLDDETFKGKVESIAVLNIFSNSIEVLTVTDNDGGDSELLWINLNLE